jgi:hypothetical protein
VRRVPLLSGSRVVVAPVGQGDVVLRPPPPPEQVADTVAAVRDALRYPLSGPPLAGLAGAGRRATIVVEPPALPYPGVQRDPRQEALSTTIDELGRSGISDERQTIVIAGGLGRRLGRRELERLLLPPPRARSFRGRIVVHDAESPELVPIAERGVGEVRIRPELLGTDLVVVVTAAETVVAGGAGALLAACDAATVRVAAGSDSLLEVSGSPGWDLALAVEAALATRVQLFGVSLVCDHPRVGGALRGFPDDDRAIERAARSDLRAVFSLLPSLLRRAALEHQDRRLAVTAAFAGPPSVAHAEALVRGVALRGVQLERPVDALVVGVPWFGPHLPRESANPISVAATALGFALRLHRDGFPLDVDGTLVLLHPLPRSFAESAQLPYGEMFEALRGERDPDALATAERAAAVSEPALAAYRAGTACHPLLPYADWAGCAPALSRLGRVVVAGCRDAAAARTLGFVPTRSVSSALTMAHGVAGGKARVGVVLGPPYPPLLGPREQGAEPSAGGGYSSPR